MKQYQCIFFDLDHTLWDYETNSEEALRELFFEYDLKAKSFDEFYSAFVKINTAIWDDYDRGHIGREIIRNERFDRIFRSVGINDYKLSLRFSEDYVNLSPTKKHLVPHTIEVLEYLFHRYSLYIITNGFEEIQSTKMESSGITRYFKGVVTSARAGWKKPEKEIFEFALRENGFACYDSIMVGDNLLTDIAGARNAMVDTVFYNPYKLSHEELVTYEISSLKELTTIL